MQMIVVGILKFQFEGGREGAGINSCELLTFMLARALRKSTQRFFPPSIFLRKNPWVLLKTF